MKSLAKLINENYSPNYQDTFYLQEQYKPSLICEGRGFGSYNVEFFWNIENPKLDTYYLHPYFPNGIIDQVVLLQDIPGSMGTRGTVLEVHNDMFVLYAADHQDSKWITYTKEWIYLYPTYFKPIYL